MANLYEIDQAILDCADLESGEIIDEQALADLKLLFSDKTEGVACWIKNLLADAEAIKAEKKKLAKRQKACEDKAESLKRYLQSALNERKFSTSKVDISYRKSDVVEIIDLNKLDDDYLNYKEPEPNKSKIKASIKAGVNVPGAVLVEKNNIQIK